MNVDKAIQTRKSVKRFSEKKPDFRDIIEAIDAARFSPMAGNSYSLRFVLIDDVQIIQKLAEASQQDFVANAKYVVVACTDVAKTLNAYEDRGKRYLRQQAGAGMQNFLLKLNERGLATTWVGHFVDYLVKEAVGIPENIQIEALFPIGYERSRPVSTSKRKITLDRIIFFNKYNKKFMTKTKSINA